MATPWEEHTFTFDSGASKTRYITTGPKDGPLLILIHGWIGCAETWKPQLTALGALGYYVVAPDCRGYGGSTNTRVVSDYATARHNLDMLALLAHLSRPQAVWIGHDWGAPLVWAFAAHYPEKTLAVSGMCVPYRTAEFGIEHVAALSNHTLYPPKEYPVAQWDYMVFQNESPELSAEILDKHPEKSLFPFFMPGNPDGGDTPSRTAAVRKAGGWYGSPTAEAPDIPLSMTLLGPHPEVHAKLTETLAKNGSWGPNAYYRNFPANGVYAATSVNSGRLSMPVLWVGARYDWVCETVKTRLCEPMREYCDDLTEVVIDAGHWAALEKPRETNEAVVSWLREKVGGEYKR